MKYLITGCSRGIGREMAIQLLATGASVIATARNVSSLADIAPGSPNLLRIALDIDSDESAADALAELKQRREFWPVDVLVHNAGVLFAESSSAATRAAFRGSFETNAISPFFFTLNATAFLAPENAKVVFVTSRMGSIADNASSSWVAYRASKCAMNMVAKCLSIDLREKFKECCVVLLHPGWVKTDMGYKAGGEPPLETAESVQGLIKVMCELDPSKNGMFLSQVGEEIPW